VSNEFFEKVEKILKEKVESCFVLYHFDVDGCGAAAYIKKIFYKIKKKAKFYPITRGRVEENLYEKILKRNPKQIIVVDYVPSKEFVEKLKGYNLKIIDHHVRESYLGENYITSQDYGINQCMGYLLYKIAKKYGINQKYIAEVSSFWDKTLEFTEFWQENAYKKKMKLFLPFNLLVSYTQVMGSRQLMEILFSAKSLKEAIERINMIPEYVEAESEFKNEIQRMEREEIDGIEVLYINKSRFKHIRIFVDYITYTNDGTFLFVLKEKGRCKFSFRTTKEIDLLSIVKEIEKNVKGFSGGGHKKACGGMIKKEDPEEVIEEFVKLYRKSQAS